MTQRKLKETLEEGRAMYALAREEGYSLLEIIHGMITSFNWNLQIEREAQLYEDTHAGDPFSFEDYTDPDDLPF